MSELKDFKDLHESEILFRRVPVRPNFVYWDPETKEPYLAPGALQFDNDGMSVHRKVVLDDAEASPADCYDFEEHGVVSFTAAVPQQYGKAIESPVPDAGIAGSAHASITGSRTFRPSTREKVNIRDAIIAAVTWFRLPPGVEEAPPPPGLVA